MLQYNGSTLELLNVFRPKRNKLSRGGSGTEDKLDQSRNLFANLFAKVNEVPDVHEYDCDRPWGWRWEMG